MYHHDIKHCWYYECPLEESTLPLCVPSPAFTAPTNIPSYAPSVVSPAYTTPMNVQSYLPTAVSPITKGKGEE